jgi:hypothetical protein
LLFSIYLSLQHFQNRNIFFHIWQRLTHPFFDKLSRN